jgi:NAD(P)-dependent dehydrogenase (short-subunit alcohol dehydrogenase family)
MPSVLITGAGRGLGLEFAKQYAAEGWRVHASLRDPAKAGPLKALKGDIAIHRLDPGDDKEVAALAKGFAQEPIDLLINNAGTYGPREDAVAKIPYDGWLEVFRVNSIAPLKLATAFIPPVAASERRLMVFITSLMGSIAQTSGGSYPYRMSKAALNMGVKALSGDFAQQGITAVVMHPGWVRTDMGGSGAPLDPPTSIAGMRKVIAGLQKSDNARYLSYDGSQLPW